MINKKGAVWVYKILVFLGINPFMLAMNASKFIELARKLNNANITLAYDWALKLYDLTKKFGFKISLDLPHKGYSWHIHLFGGHGKFKNIHIQIVKAAWDWLKKRIG